jgi:hypothetical protein
MTAGNILVGGVIGLGVDAASGAMNEYDPVVKVAMSPIPGCKRKDFTPRPPSGPATSSRMLEPFSSEAQTKRLNGLGEMEAEVLRLTVRQRR